MGGVNRQVLAPPCGIMLGTLTGLDFAEELSAVILSAPGPCILVAVRDHAGSVGSEAGSVKAMTGVSPAHLNHY